MPVSSPASDAIVCGATMLRVNTQEILDSDACPPVEVEASLRDICRINRWFGGVATTRKLIERVAHATGVKRFSVLEVAAGFGEVSKIAGRQLERKGITLDVTDLDRVSHSPGPRQPRRGCRRARASLSRRQFRSGQLQPLRASSGARRTGALYQRGVAREPLRGLDQRSGSPSPASGAGVRGLCRDAELCVASGWLGVGATSLRSGRDAADSVVGYAEPPAQVEISRHFLFRMGVIAWKRSNC